MATVEVITRDIVEVPVPDTRLLVTEDDTPMDNIYVEKQQRLLTEPLYSSWVPADGHPYLVLANVGLFYAEKQPAIVPDVMLSLDVPEILDRREDDNRSYFSWVFGKMPEVVVEIVSDRRACEDSDKMRSYQRLHIPYYVIYDPSERLHAGVLRAFALTGWKYQAIDPAAFAEVGLGLVLWDGAYEGDATQWLRWCDADGRIIPTGRERAEKEKERAEKEKERAEKERERANTAEEKNRRLMERLQQLGVSMD